MTQSVRLSRNMILLVGLLVTPAPLLGAEFTFREDVSIHYCLEEILADRFKVLPRMPVGCEIIDCCPGCPAGKRFVNLDARISGDFARGMTLSFSDPDGFAWWARGGRDGRVAVPPDERVRIRGVRVAEFDRPRFVQPTLEFDGDRLRERIGSGGEPVAGVVELRSRLGPIPVFDVAYRWEVERCELPGPPPADTDTIELTENAGGTETVVVLSGNRQVGPDESCFHDEVHDVVDQQDIDNVAASDGGSNCLAEALAFSSGDAMEVVDTTSAFTDAPGDTLTIDMGPPLEPELKLWRTPRSVLWPLLDHEPDLDRGDALFDVCGVSLDASLAPVTYDGGPLGIDSALMAAAVNLYLNVLPDFTCPGGVLSAMDWIRASGFYDASPKVMNIYYTVLPLTGYFCSNVPDIVVMGTTKNTETLSHELGHAFSLWWHAQNANDLGTATFDNTNVMWGTDSSVGPGTRDHFTLGQCQRMNVQSNSFLDQLRTAVDDLHYDCPGIGTPIAPSDRCLPADFDP